MLAAVLLSTLAQAADDAAWRQACPGAAAWTDANEAQSIQAMQRRDQARRPTHPELLAELTRRVAEDQAARRRLISGGFTRRRWQDAVAVDADNLRWLARVIRSTGFPTAAQVGEYGLHLTWLLVHHADSQPAFQQAAIAEFKQRYEAGEFAAADLARLTDRVLKRQGKSQAFGTQFDWASGPQLIYQIDNLAEIERNRQALGLMPLSDYGCMMHALRGPSAD